MAAEHDRTIWPDILRERQSHVVTFVMRDADGVVVPKAALDTLILDLRDKETRAVINGREHQNVLDAPHQVTMHATSGLVTWTMLPEDSPFSGSDEAGRQLRQLDAHFYWTWGGSGAHESGHIIEVRIRNVKQYPVTPVPTVTTVTLAGDEFTADGSPIEPAVVTVTGPDGVILTPDPVYADNTAAGTGSASYSFPGSPAYLPSSDAQTFTIVEPGEEDPEDPDPPEDEDATAHANFDARAAREDCVLAYSLRVPQSGLGGATAPHVLEPDALKIVLPNTVVVDGSHTGVQALISPIPHVSLTAITGLVTTAIFADFRAGPLWTAPDGYLGTHKWFNLRRNNTSIWIEPGARYRSDRTMFISRLRTYGSTIGPGGYLASGGFHVIGAAGDQVTSGSTTLRLVSPAGVLTPTVVPSGTRYSAFDSDSIGPVLALVAVPANTWVRILLVIERPGDGYAYLTYAAAHEAMDATVILYRVPVSMPNTDTLRRFEYECNTSLLRVRDQPDLYPLVPATIAAYGRDVTVHACTRATALGLLTRPVRAAGE